MAFYGDLQREDTGSVAGGAESARPVESLGDQGACPDGLRAVQGGAVSTVTAPGLGCLGSVPGPPSMCPLTTGFLWPRNHWRVTGRGLCVSSSERLKTHASRLPGHSQTSPRSSAGATSQRSGRADRGLQAGEGGPGQGGAACPGVPPALSL